MAYQLIFSNTAVKNLHSVNKRDVRRIVEALEELANNPDEKANVKQLINHLKATYRLRVGNYRVLFDREDRLRVIDVIDVGHRKNIY
jgi:mRNA interferase RelE/StbE